MGCSATSLNGMVTCSEVRYVLKNGRIDVDFYGVYKYADKQWYYFEKGVNNTKGIGILPLDGVSYFIQNGKVDFEYTGVFNDYRGTAPFYAYRIEKGVMVEKFLLEE